MFKMMILIALLAFLPSLQETGRKPDQEQEADGKKLETDVYKTKKGDLTITFIGHGTLMFEFDGKVIHVDPVSGYADYSKMPAADIILVTHEHGDHLDMKAVEKITKEETELVLTKTCYRKVETGTVMANGKSKVFKGIKVEAVPAYNVKHKRGDGSPFHPKGDGNGYVIAFADKKVYVAGDTENIPEMKGLEGVDIAFLPMNLPYTMTPEMAADAAMMIKPKVLYPYHFGKTDTSELVELLADHEEIEVKIRKME